MTIRTQHLQTTLRRRVELTGVGVHSGRPARLTLAPAEAGSGVVFFRSDLDGVAERGIAADHRSVTATDHCTRLSRGLASVATVEHVMATLRGLEIDNAQVEVDGPEVPVLDGSAAPIVAAIDRAGIATLPVPRRVIRVLKPVRVEIGRSIGELRPSAVSRIEVEIDFTHPLIGRQSYGGAVGPAMFRRDLARARTFGFIADVEKLWAAGLALGASLENAVVLGEDRVINPEGLRFADEFVRHKALDALGDLALAGAPILGTYRSYRGGHGLNVAMLKALFADRDAWTMDELAVRREPLAAELPVHLEAALYGPMTA